MTMLILIFINRILLLFTIIIILWSGSTSVPTLFQDCQNFIFRAVAKKSCNLQISTTEWGQPYLFRNDHTAQGPRF